MGENEDIRTLLKYMDEKNEVRGNALMETMQQLEARLAKVETAGKYGGTVEEETSHLKMNHPKGEAGRSGNNPEKPGYNLFKEMDVSRPIYLKVRAFIRTQCARHGISPEMPLSRIPVEVGAITQLTLRKFNLKPDLEWAIRVILRTFQQGKRASERRREKKDSIEISPSIPALALKARLSHDLSQSPLPLITPTHALNAGFEDFLASQDSQKEFQSKDFITESAIVSSAVRLLPQGAISVFMDKEGFFYYADDSHLELVYNEKDNQFYFENGDHELHLDLMPTGLNGYIYTFSDGVERSQSTLGYYEVGFMVPLPQIPNHPHPICLDSPMSSLPDLDDFPISTPPISATNVASIVMAVEEEAVPKRANARVKAKSTAKPKPKEVVKKKPKSPKVLKVEPKAAVTKRTRSSKAKIKDHAIPMD